MIDLLTRQQAAELLGISQARVRGLANRQGISYIRTQRAIYYPAAPILAAAPLPAGPVVAAPGTVAAARLHRFIHNPLNRLTTTRSAR